MNGGKYMQEPFIHLFSCSTGKYLYDVNSDTILKISDESNEILKNNGTFNSQLEQLKKMGFLKKNKVQISEHPAGVLLPEFYKNGLRGLTLQVTQNCNLRCSYCVYSGQYDTRVHSNKKMNFELAKKGIDYLLAHSQETQELRIGFYGGEPLLEFPLIEQCVNYMNQHANGKKIHYYVTTNATLLNENITQFLVKHNFSLTISFDGPKEIHDSQRKFVNSNDGSFDIVIKRLNYLRKNYYDYLVKQASVNIVLNPSNAYKFISDFFMQEEVFQEIHVVATLISDTGKKEKYEISSLFKEEYYYEYFKLLMSALGRLNPRFVSPIMKTEFNTLCQVRGGKQQNGTNILPPKWHHGGPCIPGERTIFLNADGVFYPCERVCENPEAASIGDVERGIDIDRAISMLNVERQTSDMCHNCWAYQYCDFCIRMAGQEKNSLKDNVISTCNYMRKNTENLFKDYCVLKELGYDFETNYNKGVM